MLSDNQGVFYHNQTTQQHKQNILWENNPLGEYMWCDLRKPVTWYKIDSLSYWYHVKVWIISIPELFTWIFSDTGNKNTNDQRL